MYYIYGVGRIVQIHFTGILVRTRNDFHAISISTIAVKNTAYITVSFKQILQLRMSL